MYRKNTCHSRNESRNIPISVHDDRPIYVCANLGKEVAVHFVDGRKDEKGICTDILSDGSMNVTTNEGILNVNSGEVSVKGIYDFERNDIK